MQSVASSSTDWTCQEPTGNSHDHAAQVAVEVRVGRDLSKRASYAGYKGGHVKRKQVGFEGERKK